jgi:hypothetical protein
VAVVSFKSKYIAVAVVAAIALALAVGFVLVIENRVQHAALLDSAATDARGRVARELALRAEEISRHAAGRVDQSVLLADRAAIASELEGFKGDGTVLGIVVRDLAGNRLYAWRRNEDIGGAITRSAIAPIRANLQTLPGIETPRNRRRTRNRGPLAGTGAGFGGRTHALRFAGAHPGAQGTGHLRRAGRRGLVRGLRARVVGGTARAPADHLADQECRSHRAR